MRTSSSQKQEKSDLLGEMTSCPFIGLEEDAETWLAYPHPYNYCHKANPICNLSLVYQESTCLTTRHLNCQGFVQGWNGPLPPQYSGEKVSQKPRKNLLVPTLSIILLLMVMSAWFAYRQGWVGAGSENADNTQAALLLSSSQTSSAEQQRTQISLDAENTAIPTPSPNLPLTKTTIALLVTTTPKATLAPTETPTAIIPTPGPSLDMPFGPGGKYVLHKLATGESLGTLVSRYNTSIKVIEASNVLVSGASIWPETVLLIVPGEKNPENVTRFKVIFTETAALVSDLASEYNVSVEDLRLYNSLGPGEEIPAGRYLIIPVL